MKLVPPRIRIFLYDYIIFVKMANQKVKIDIFKAKT